MKLFDKAFIESFAQPVDENVLNESVGVVCELLGQAVENISKSKVAVAKFYEILPDGELASGAISSTSSLDFLLVLNSPQLILNTQKLVDNKFKSFWIKLKAAWKRANTSRRQKKKLKKKKEKPSLEPTKYTLYNFSKDLVTQLAMNLSNLSIVTMSNIDITIEGEDLPFVVNVKVLIKTEKGFGYYDSNKNKIISFNYGHRNENINSSAKGLALTRIYNNLYYNLYKEAPSQIFIESLIFNMPEGIFAPDDIYEVFIKSINYLNNTNLTLFKSVIDKDVSLWKEPLNGIGIGYARQFVDKIIASL